jgi:hypothetical protein
MNFISAALFCFLVLCNSLRYNKPVVYKLPKLRGRVEWIQLAQDRDRWRAVVSAVMNLRVLAPRS